MLFFFIRRVLSTLVLMCISLASINNKDLELGDNCQAISIIVSSKKCFKEAKAAMLVRKTKERLFADSKLLDMGDLNILMY